MVTCWPGLTRCPVETPATVTVGPAVSATRNVIGAFQMKYRPARYDGEMDAETAAILDVMTASPSNAP